MASRLNLARVGAAVLGASVALVLSAALPASAAGPAQNESGLPSAHDDIAGTQITMDYTGANGKPVESVVPPTLIGLRLDNGEVLHTYCLQLTVDLKNDVTLTRVPWNSFPNNASGFNAHNKQINWILHNSYPQITDLTALSKAAGLPDTISSQDAIAGTQAAIWNLTDGATITQQATHPGAKIADADINGLFKYLTGSANVGMDQPSGTPTADPTLSLSPKTTNPLAGQAGGKIGPFTVSTNLTGVELTSSLPNGVTLVDGNGATLDAAKVVNGTKVYFNVPAGQASGEASFTMSSSATIGELFVGTADGQRDGAPQTQGARSNCSPDKVTQSVIAAETSVAQTVSVQWAAGVVTSTTTTAPTTTTKPTSTSTTTESTTTAPAVAAPSTTNTSGGSSLPFTGVSLIVPIALAVVLIGGGATFLLLQRRKRAAQH